VVQKIVGFGRSGCHPPLGPNVNKKPTATGAIGSSKGETMSLEELLRSHPTGRFRIRTQGVDGDEVRIYISPEDGEAVLHFKVQGDTITPIVYG
jgi:hypothetical protein